MTFPYLTLNWDLYVPKYVSFKGAEYYYGRDCLLQPTSLLSGCTAASQWWLLPLYLRSFRTREKKICFQLEKLIFICSQPLPCIEAVGRIIQKSVPLTLCAQILWWSPYSKNFYWEKNAHGAIIVLHRVLWVPEETLSWVLGSAEPLST